ncbi:unnamed protein product [Lymnaea stagnalis]|uniref:Uncharacterized protein n=1 Tax=Lymnaea stagnalis TaxID=6523 RepID=A0AAV2I7P7_LYMST
MWNEHSLPLLVIIAMVLCRKATSESALTINVTVGPLELYLLKLSPAELEGFYSCLCNDGVKMCGANTSQSTVQDIFYESQNTSEKFSPVFECELKSPTFSSLECHRQPMSSCNCTTDCFIYRVNDRACSNGPVAVKWSQYISGIFDNKMMSITKGNDSLCTAATTTPGIPAPPLDGVNTVATSLVEGDVPQVKSDFFQGITDDPDGGHNGGLPPDDNTGVIVGVLFGIVFLVAIVVVAFLIWKRNLLDKLPKLGVLTRRLLRRTARNAETSPTQYDDSSEYNDVDYQVANGAVIKDNNNFVIAIEPSDGLQYFSNRSVNDNEVANPAFVVDSLSESDGTEDYENIQFNNGNDDGLVYEDGNKEIAAARSDVIDGDEESNYDAVYESSANLSRNSAVDCPDAGVHHEKVPETSSGNEYANVANVYAKLNKKGSEPDGGCNGVVDTYEDVDLQARMKNEFSHSLALALSERSSKNKAQSMLEIVHLPPKKTNSEEIETNVNRPDTNSLVTNSRLTEKTISSIGDPLQEESQEKGAHDYNNSSPLSADVHEIPNVYFELEKETDDYGLAEDAVDVIEEGFEEQFDYFAHSDV